MNEEDMECKVIASLMIMLDDKFSNEAKIKAMEDVKIIFKKQQKEIEFYKMQELGYIAGYEDGKSHKQTAVAIRNENAQYELIRRHIEELEDELKDCIHKDTIRKLKELVHKTLDDNGITRGYQLTIDNYFKELLGE